MKIIKTTSGDDFYLLRDTCRDRSFYAKRSAVRKAIELTEKVGRGHSTGDVLLIRALPSELRKGREMSRWLKTDVEMYRNGFLRLGCHLFNHKTALMIEAWAWGAK